MKRMLVLIAGVLAIAAVATPALVDDSPATSTVSVQLAGHTFTLPRGFTIEQVATSPLVDRPITASFDDQGRLYVTDSSGSNDKVDKQLADKPHRVVCLEDTDGDGKFDKSTVFADKLMFPEGSLWFDGSLYVATPPSIWKLTDRDGDGVADEREEWFPGKTITGCANDLHGPYLGPDGWIYWCKGAFARQTYERTGKTLRVINGLPLNIIGKEVPVERGSNEPFTMPEHTWTTRASHIFRCRPDGSGLEVVMTGGMDNPVDVAFTANGERIFTTTFLQNPGGGRRDGLLHAVYGGIYGKDHDPIHEASHHWTGPDLMPVLAHLGAAAPCGLTSYRSTAFGVDFQDNLFACLFNMHKVTRHKLVADGATYQSHDSDFVVSSNLDFHPTDILEDADGSLIIVDTGGWYKLCCPTSQLHKPDILGSIYRVRRAGAPRVADPRGLSIEWSTLSTGELCAYLGDHRPAVCDRAIKCLAERGTEAVSDLASTVGASSLKGSGSRGSSAAVRKNAIWALTRIDSPAARTAIRAALQDKDSGVVQVAAHSVSLLRDRDAIPQLLDLLKRTDAQCRRVAAEAIGRIGEKSCVPALLAAARAIDDDKTAAPAEPANSGVRFLEHSITYALIEIGDSTATTRGLTDSNARVRRIALVALDQMEHGGLDAIQVARLLESSDGPERATAGWIISRHSEWGSELADTLRRRLMAPELAEADRPELTRQLAQFGRTGTVQELLASVVQSGQLPGGAAVASRARQTAFAAMRDSGLKELPKSWLAALIYGLGSGDAESETRAVAVARAMPPAKDGAAPIAAALVAYAANNDRPVAVRLDALAAVPGGMPKIDPALFEFLTRNLDPESPVRDRSAAVEVLSKAKLTKEQLDVLVGLLGTAGPLEVDRLLASFEQSSDTAVGLKLVAALKQSPSRSALRPDAVQRSIAKCGVEVQEQAEQLFAAINVDLAKQRERLEELLTTVKQGGDIRRGQAVFMSTKAACSSCHQLGYLGGNIGPDLTRIGGIRNERDLLESIAFPNASFVRSYEPVVVATRDGKVVSGLIKKDAPDELIITINATETARIAREEIDEIRPGTVSVMPSGLEQQLSPQELTDLITFLKAAK